MYQRFLNVQPLMRKTLLIASILLKPFLNGQCQNIVLCSGNVPVSFYSFSVICYCTWPLRSCAQHLSPCSALFNKKPVSPWKKLFVSPADVSWCVVY